MAEILIFNRDNQHADPAKDRAGCHKTGDIIAIMPDGWHWGREELRPADKGGIFRLVKVPGIGRYELERHIQRTFGVHPQSPVKTPGHKGIPLRRKRLRCDAANGSSLSLADFLASMADKVRMSQ